MGIFVGGLEGALVGDVVEAFVGDTDGEGERRLEGGFTGDAVGATTGIVVGEGVGDGAEGPKVICTASDGRIDGKEDGKAEGSVLGVSVDEDEGLGLIDTDGLVGGTSTGFLVTVGEGVVDERLG